MPIKAFYSLEPGEAIVAEEIKRHYPNLHIFIPEKDMGIDLIVLGDLSKVARYPLTIQVKESRCYPPSFTSWHKVGKNKLENMAEMVDFYVFVTYVDVPEGHKISFRKEFIVTPTQELLEACKKKKDSKGIYSFYFSHEYNDGYGKVLDVRDTRGLPWDEAPSYLLYYNNWEQIVDALEEQEDIRAGLLALNEPGSTSWDEYKKLRTKGG